MKNIYKVCVLFCLFFFFLSYGNSKGNSYWQRAELLLCMVSLRLKAQMQNDFIVFVKETPSFLPMCSSKAVEGNSGFDISS